MLISKTSKVIQCVLSTTQRSLSQSSFVGNQSSGECEQARLFPPRDDFMLPPNTFKGQVAFVTGGGTGLAKEIVRGLSSLGARVAISSRRKDVIEKTADEISAITDNEVLAVQGDVRDPEQMAAAADRIMETFGEPASLVVNSAAGNFVSPTERLSPNAFGTIVDIVLKGTANVTLEYGKRLIEAQKPGRFLSISATYASSGSGFVCPSATAKAGVEALTKSLAAEWGRYGIAFNAIQPGPIKTEGAFSRLDPTGEFEKKMISRIPCGRLGRKEELANMALYLLSPYSSWVTGSVFRLDGGELASMSGEFNTLSQVTKEQWDQMEAAIRKANQKKK